MNSFVVQMKSFSCIKHEQLTISQKPVACARISAFILSRPCVVVLTGKAVTPISYMRMRSYTPLTVTG